MMSGATLISLVGFTRVRENPCMSRMVRRGTLITPAGFNGLGLNSDQWILTVKRSAYQYIISGFQQIENEVLFFNTIRNRQSVLLVNYISRIVAVLGSNFRCSCFREKWLRIYNEVFTQYCVFHTTISFIHVLTFFDCHILNDPLSFSKT